MISGTAQRFKIIVEYDGRRFHGWQRQHNLPSVQEAIETALKKFCQQDLKVIAAGRTDAGVHARGQVVHFDIDYGEKLPEGHIVMNALNAHLRSVAVPVAVVSAAPVAQDFHARFSAKNKLYHYHILNRSAMIAIDKGLAWHVGKTLDIESMRAAAALLIGYHDFSTFRDSECQAKSPMKTLDRLDIMTQPLMNGDGQNVIIAAESLSFLHHQVRNMVGSLKLVGTGKWSVADFKSALEAKDRKVGGPTAPADGLYLMRVDY